MDSVQLFAKIDELYPEYIKVFEDVCSIESPTYNKEAVDRVGSYFADMARARGWHVETLKQEKAGDPVVITLNYGVDAAPVAMSGHIDTVHPIGAFSYPAVRIDENNIYGPGVMDCKGGVVASFLAMDALDKCGFRARPVQLLIQTDEEVGSSLSEKATINYICEKAKNAVAFLNTEGGEYGNAVIERKGILRAEIRVKGIAAHSSVCTKAANAVAEAAHKLLELEKMKDEKGLTCNCGVISGGTTPNTVAESCKFTVDIRFANARQLKMAESEIKRVVDTVYVNGCGSEYEIISLRPAMELCERNIKLLESINRVNAEVGLEPLVAREEPSGSDAAYATIAGIPSIDNIGVVGDFIHSTREYAELKSLVHSARQLAAVAAFI